MWGELERVGLARWQVATTTCTTAFVMLLAIGVLSSDACKDDCIAEWRLVGAAAALCALNFLAVLCARRRDPQLEQQGASTTVASAVPRYSQEERSSMM